MNPTDKAASDDSALATPPRPAPSSQSGAGQADWLVGGGEMAKLIKSKDWSKTALGPIESWPQSLRTVVSLMQASNSPISLSWGPGHVQIYNDGYWPICGDKHPTSMGQDFRECWAAPWPVISGSYHTAKNGKTSYLEKMRMFLERYGFMEETWFTFSFSPVTDESGKVGGLFHPVTEMTSQMLSERRNRTLHELASRAGKAKTTPDAFQLATQVLAESDLDLPFVMFYLVEADGRSANLVAQTGLVAGTALSPQVVDLQTSSSAPWIEEVVRTGQVQQIKDVAKQLWAMTVGPYPELPQTAFAHPIMAPGQERPAAVMVAGASARLPINEAYRSFYDLIAAAVSTGLANARAYEEERRKAEALAEIDRAKTAFFSNVSHEFRTPLTLMLAPLEDELNERDSPLPEPRRQRIEAAHRNSLRLLKLVNTLLDFSRIEAGRTKALYQPTALARLTADLASSFRSAVERGGLTLNVECPALPQPIYVDREMWEKIVLNLLSNAFKHTFAGSITVRLSWRDNAVELCVEDTGVGIPAGELPKLFQRFHRVQGAASRTNEGTGIGLSLVQELVKLHEGAIHIESEEGRGSRFIVTLPAGQAHLPAEQIGGGAVQAALGRRAAAFVQEALHWLPDFEGGATDRPDEGEVAHESGGAAVTGSRLRIVWADDNADMRHYVTRLLRGSYDVVSVSDGEAALRAALATPPDLILSDVMMPKLDGFGLIKALRQDERTRMVPVILLSARAGEESALEGLEAGADDYLVKPFSAKELLARVRSCLALSLLRKDSAAKLEQANRDLVRAAQAKAVFLANMSHEIRTPMNAVIGMTSLLLNTEQTTEQRDFTETIRASGDHLLTVINEILDFSKIEAGKLLLESTRFSLRQCVEDAIDVVSIKAAEKQLDLGYFIAADVPQAFLGDAGRMRQVLINLLSNAVKFTERGEVVVSVAATPRSGAQYDLQISVRDTGIGIPQDRRDRLFLAFSQVDASITRHYGGTGLGLAISQKLAELMGGRIWVDSEAGKGSTFHFTVVAEALTGEAASRRSPALGMSGLRVLIVDDNVTNLKIVESYISSWGLLPVCVQSPRDALALIQNGQHFDLAIIDYLMPEMDGFVLGSEIRKQPIGQRLPMVLLSSVTFARSELLLREPRFSSLATKPLRPSTLQNAIAEALFAARPAVLLGEPAEQLPERLTERLDAQRTPILNAKRGKQFPLRILVVEDNAVNQKVATLLLGKMGYSADIAGNGIEALQAIARQIYDVVFMDVQMPDMDGLTATREACRKWPPEQRPRIVGMTANATDADRKECLSAGMDDYIAKPVTVPRLEIVLERCARREA